MSSEIDAQSRSRSRSRSQDRSAKKSLNGKVLSPLLAKPENANPDPENVPSNNGYQQKVSPAQCASDATVAIEPKKISPEEAEKIKLKRDKEINEYLVLHKIKVIKGRAPRPVLKFEDIKFPPFIAKQIQIAGFLAPTPIQSQCWPILFQGKSLIGIAKTGSGKTLAYMIPAILHLFFLITTQKYEGSAILVLGPTRELVLQIYEETLKFTFGSNLRIACVYGGAEKQRQRRDLQGGAQIIVACPGRLLDFLEEGSVSLSKVSYFVLDEADRMLDMGFEPQIRRVLGYMRKYRQTVMCSATWPREVQNLADEIFVDDAVHVQIGENELIANDKITQKILMIEDYEKMKTLLKCLEEIVQPFQAIIFAKTKKGCDRLSRDLRLKGYNTLSLHGDKSQNEREFVLDSFRKKRVNILVATDVAARGLDIKNVTYVINFDFPMQIEDYVHRIGRTGRAGETGTSISFFSSEDYPLARDLIKVLKDAKQNIPEELCEQESNFRKRNDYNRFFDFRSFRSSFTGVTGPSKNNFDLQNFVTTKTSQTLNTANQENKIISLNTTKTIITSNAEKPITITKIVTGPQKIDVSSTQNNINVSKNQKSIPFNKENNIARAFPVSGNYCQQANPDNYAKKVSSNPKPNVIAQNKNSEEEVKYSTKPLQFPFMAAVQVNPAGMQIAQMSGWAMPATTTQTQQQ